MWAISERSQSYRWPWTQGLSLLVSGGKDIEHEMMARYGYMRANMTILRYGLILSAHTIENAARDHSLSCFR